MSINSALTMAVNAMQVNQLSLNVVQNNVANMNTEGYSKQRVNLGTRVIGGASSAFNINTQAYRNAGVQINSISRYSNEYLTEYYRNNNSKLSYSQTSSEIASRITTLMDELSDGGLSKAFDEFYTAVTNLQQKPTDNTARMDYVEKANNVAILMNSKYKDLTAYRETLVGDGGSTSLEASQLVDNVNKANTLLEDLATVNSRIVSSGTLNSAANNLYDQRDAILTELSGYLDIKTSIDANGVASVTLDGWDLVRHTTVSGKINVEPNNTVEDADRAILSLVNPADGKVLKSNLKDNINGGSIGAILEMGGKSDTSLTVQSSIDLLNDLAKGFAEVLNEIQTQGWNADGTPDTNATSYAMAISKDADGNVILVSPTEKLFVTSDGSREITAGNIMVNTNLRNDVSGLAVAKVTRDAGTPALDPADPKNGFFETLAGGGYTLSNETDRFGVGNGKNMIDVLATRDSTKNASLQNLTPEDFLMSGISKIGILADSIENQGETQESIAQSIGDQLKSETSVDLNEELTDMIKYQRSYEASARVFNTCCDILNVLVNLGA